MEHPKIGASSWFYYKENYSTISCFGIRVLFSSSLLNNGIKVQRANLLIAPPSLECLKHIKTSIF
jgi:hypothetical protein